MIQFLLKHGVSVQHEQPLHYAVRNERENEIIELFIEKGAALNDLMFQNHQLSFFHFKTFALDTSLHEAAQKKNARLITLLLQNEVDRNIRDTVSNLSVIE